MRKELTLFLKSRRSEGSGRSNRITYVYVYVLFIQNIIYKILNNKKYDAAIKY